MLINIVSKRRFKVIAVFIAVNLIAQMGFPTMAWALTSGPSQPEVGSFEPVSTNQMVDLFSGDFTYNIPLMNVPGPNGGYPINLAYHAGIGMEQEASWVGLGWNINAGVINRTMRGLPDDFNGDDITKTVHMKPQRKLSLSASAGLDVEIFGVEPTKGSEALVSASTGVYYDNYKGVGTIFGLGLSTPAADMFGGAMQGSLSITSDSKEGLGISPNLAYANEIKGKGFGFETGLNFNSRQGLNEITFAAGRRDITMKAHYNEDGSLNVKRTKKSQKIVNKGGAAVSFSSSTYVPMMDMPKGGFGASFAMEIGGDLFGLNQNPLKLDVAYNESNISENEIAFNGYGYLYAQNNTEGRNLADFNREKDIPVNKNTKSLPIPSATYDVYSVKGQGTGGAFRTYRSDVGVFKDPVISGSTTGFGLGPELGVGSGVKVGVNPKLSLATSYSGPWTGNASEVTGDYAFQGVTVNNSYEPAYFKALGETVPAEDMAGGSHNTDENPFRFEIGTTYQMPFSAIPVARNLVKTGNSMQQFTAAKTTAREKRVQSIEYLTHNELNGYREYENKHQFTNTYSNTYYKQVASTSKYDYSISSRADHIGRISVVNPDGNRYVYGLPAYNTLQRDVMFSVDGDSSPTGRVRTYDTGDNMTSNNKGISNLYSRTDMSEYAHSYLLTEVLSPDYVDITGDGPTDDDLGYWVKFNYITKVDDYHWRAPYGEPSTNQNKYPEGNNIENNISDDMDDMSGYSYGTKEIMYLESIETKTHVAEFYLDERLDAIGANSENGGLPSSVASQQLLRLEKIELKSKENTNKVIKTVHFDYDYTLCANVKNHSSYTTSTELGPGKLTLKKIWFTYLDNDVKGSLSPYEFTYSTNPNYDINKMDRWGNYQKEGPFKKSTSGYVDPSQNYPYCNQDQTYTDRDDDATAWNLTQVLLPSGGELNISYESDDYAYVQDKPANQMYKILGTGTSTSGKLSAAPLSNDHTRIYIQLNKTMDQDELKACIMDIDQVYFKSYMHLKDFVDGGGTAKDYVEGYMKMVDNPTYGSNFGFENGTNNDDEAWFTVQNVSSNQVISTDVHPIKMAGLRDIRYNRVDLISGQNTGMGAINSALSIATVVPTVLNTISSAMQMLSGFYNHGILSGWCDYIDVTDTYPSYVRLGIPDGKKYGGGCRVTSVKLDDSWDQLNTPAKYTPSTYGQTYKYVLEDGTTSSGVAEYEPLIGGEENPFRRPIRYAADGMIIKDEALMVEEPFNESLFPSANVGYSRVVVENIGHQDNQQTPEDIKRAVSGITVNEFYTARDFPVYTQRTDVDYEGYNKIIPIPFIGSRTYHNNGYSQGYSIELNNMHGKPYSIANYEPPVDDLDPQPGDPGVEPIAATYYYYKTQDPFVRYKTGGNKLDNSVTILSGDANISTEEIGKHIDTYVDMRENSSSSKNFEILPNLNAGWFYLVATAMMFVDESAAMFRSVTTNKVITRNGILDEQVTFKEGARTATKNLYYDAETGSPLLATTTNDFDQPIYDYTYAAHWDHEGMEGAYNNVGAIVSTLSSNLVKAGDEVIDLGNNNKWIWVESKSPLTLKDKDGNAPSTTGNFKIIRSSYRNQQSVPMGNIVSLINPVTARDFPLFTAINTATKTTSPPITIGEEIIADFSMTDCFDATISFTNSLDLTISATNQLTVKDAGTSLCDGGEENFLTITFTGSVDLTNVNNFDVTTMTLSKHGNDIKAVDGSGNTIWGTIENAECLNECLDGVLHASSAKYKSLWNIDYEDAGIPTSAIAASNYNTTRYGADNIWRLHETFLFNIDRKQSDLDNPAGTPHQTQTGKDGTYDNFVLFNWDPAYTNNLWTKTNTINEYSPYGYELENEDALGIKSSAMYSYAHSVVTAVSSNTDYDEIVFDGFEDYNGTSYAYASGWEGSYGHFKLTTATLSNSEAHTGDYSVAITSGNNAEFAHTYASNDAGKFLPTSGKEYYFSAWVKIANTSTTATLKIDNNTIDVSSNSVQAIEGWQRLEGKFTAGATSINIKVEAAGGMVYLDDVRIQPFQSAMKTYVYDPETLWLIAELDDRNYATFYNYDEEGNLVQIKKETAKGLRTIVSNRKNVSQ